MNQSIQGFPNRPRSGVQRGDGRFGPGVDTIVITTPATRLWKLGVLESHGDFNFHLDEEGVHLWKNRAVPPLVPTRAILKAVRVLAEALIGVPPANAALHFAAPSKPRPRRSRRPASGESRGWSRGTTSRKGKPSGRGSRSRSVRKQ